MFKKHKQVQGKNQDFKFKEGLHSFVRYSIYDLSAQDFMVSRISWYLHVGSLLTALLICNNNQRRLGAL